ncbi:AraC family transcriptional regulator [Halovulum marinum]|uniref:AraC family transcriptional regulator n=1 Tax=Halovulum marinum TaxID=2662447 RepID=UPI002D79F597|nr:AraC family transcriptional regulator [Halovulum marinum]
MSELPVLCQDSATDPLTDALRMVKLTGAVFHLVDASTPWGVEIPRAQDYSPIILPRAQHVISYHIILKGAGWIEIPGVASTWFEAGDILVLAHGDPYALLSAPGQTPEFDRTATIAFFRDWMAGKVPFVMREGGGGPGGAEYMCGFLGCDMRPFNPLLSTLPRLLRVNWSRNDQRDLLGRLIDLTLTDARLPRLGGESIRMRLSELIFVEVIRLFVQSLPAHETGWLSGLRDPAIGKVLAVIHEAPAHHWTLAALAKEAAMSRSAMVARFTHLIGHSPMQYLTLWRMQIAARLLADSSMKVASVGHEIGYESEAAFSRVFKKTVGVSPARWRANAIAGI